MLSSSIIDIPRPYIDPIDSLLEALSVVCLALPRPIQNCTLVLSLDHKRRGINVSLFDALSPEVVHNIVGDAARHSNIESVVLVSLRTQSPLRLTDLELFRFMSSVFSNSGITLFDWAVIGQGGLYCPRSLLNQPDPWPYSAIAW